ncbi:MAG: fimbrillin family protein [Rikenellaceae bacterium]
MKQFKHILYIIIILAILSCEKTNLNDSNDNQQLMTFNSSVESTKAFQADSAVLKDVYGEFSVATFLASDDKTHYYSDVVSYTGSLWSSGATRYWPVGNNLDMFAYSPIKDFIVIEDSETYADYSLVFTSPSAIDDQIDLLAITITNQAYENTNGIVDLKFKHILSSVKFSIGFTESDVTLEKIAINYVNIEKQRTYNFAKEEWGNSENEYFDSTDGLPTYIIVDENKTTADTDTDPIIFDDIDNQLMIIPQPISTSESDPHYLSVQISYSLSGADTKTTDIIPLTAPIGGSYEQGCVYTYDITVK